MHEYSDARDAATRWFCLVEMSQAGFARSFDLLEACANAHNQGTGVVVSDHPWQSELDERWSLDAVMRRVLRGAGDARFGRWMDYRYRGQGRRCGVVRSVDALLEVELNQQDMLRSR